VILDKKRIKSCEFDIDESTKRRSFRNGGPNKIRTCDHYLVETIPQRYNTIYSKTKPRIIGVYYISKVLPVIKIIQSSYITFYITYNKGKYGAQESIKTY